MQFLRGVGVAAAHGRASASGAARPDTSRMCASSIRTARFAPRALAPGLASFAPRACAPRACAPGLASAVAQVGGHSVRRVHSRRARRPARLARWFSARTGRAHCTCPGDHGAGRMPRPPTAGMPTCRAAQPTSVMWACRPTAPGRARHAHARPVLRSPRHVRAERTDGGGHLDGGGVDRWSGGGLAGFSRVKSRTWATQKSSSTSLYRARRGAGTVTRRCTTVQSPVCAMDSIHREKDSRTMDFERHGQ